MWICLAGIEHGPLFASPTPGSGKAPGREAPPGIFYPSETISVSRSPVPPIPYTTICICLSYPNSVPLSLSAPLIPDLLDVVHREGVWRTLSPPPPPPVVLSLRGGWRSALQLLLHWYATLTDRVVHEGDVHFS